MLGIQVGEDVTSQADSSFLELLQANYRHGLPTSFPDTQSTPLTEYFGPEELDESDTLTAVTGTAVRDADAIPYLPPEAPLMKIPSNPFTSLIDKMVKDLCKERKLYYVFRNF